MSDKTRVKLIKAPHGTWDMLVTVVWGQGDQINVGIAGVGDNVMHTHKKYVGNGASFVRWLMDMIDSIYEQTDDPFHVTVETEASSPMRFLAIYEGGDWRPFIEL